MKAGLTALTTACLAALFSGCMSSLTPHENFISLMNHNVGDSIDDPRVVGSAEPKYLLESKSLPNGNIENTYQGRGSCRIFFEYNPQTRIIVAFRFEGTEQDCEIVP